MSKDEEEAERIVFAICAVCCLIFLVGVVAFLFVGANDVDEEGELLRRDRGDRDPRPIQIVVLVTEAPATGENLTNIASYRSTHATNHCTTSHPYTCGTGFWHTNVYAKSADKGHVRSDKAPDEPADNSTHSKPDCSAYA
ncbi:hypothetical protein MRX96_014960 [Rhipicephalus microplus]